MEKKIKKAKSINIENGELVQQLSQLLYNRTQKWAKEQGLLQNDSKNKLSQKAKNIAKIIQSHNFGCHKIAVIELVEAIIVEELNIDRGYDYIDFENAIVFVPLTGQELIIGDPVLVNIDNEGDVSAIGLNKSARDMPCYKKDSIRSAELVEIEWLIKGLLEKDEFSIHLLNMALSNLHNRNRNQD